MSDPSAHADLYAEMASVQDNLQTTRQHLEALSHQYEQTQHDYMALRQHYIDLERQRHQAEQVVQQSAILPNTTDVTDDQWALLAPLLQPPHRRGRPCSDTRRTLNGILYVVNAGTSWSSMPACYGNHITCWRWYQRWQFAGVWKHVERILAHTPVSVRNKPLLG